MPHPFTIIKGGQEDPVPPPTKFITFDNTRTEIERMRMRFYAQRDKAILKERSKNKKS